MLCVLAGASTAAMLGESYVIFDQEVTLHSWGNWKPLEK